MSESPTQNEQHGQPGLLAKGVAISPCAGLLLLTLFTLPLLLVYLGRGDANDMMEFFNLIPVREAYRDGHWLMPTLNGEPRLEKPPLPVWLPAGLARVAGTDSLMVLRFPSILAGLLTAASVFGIGCLAFRRGRDSEGEERADVWPALLSAMMVPTFLIFNRQSRLASYDIFATAFLALAMYFLVMTIQRMRHGKAAGGTVLAVIAGGVAFGLSVMSKGPVPGATVLGPMAVWLAVEQWRNRWSAEKKVRVGKLIGYGIVFVVAGLATFLPWLIVIGATVDGAWDRWWTEFFQFFSAHTAHAKEASADLRDPVYYYLQFLVWIVPFTPTFIAGLLLPWLTSQGSPKPTEEERSYRRLFWMIVILGLVMLTVPSEKKPRYALQLMPYAALLCGAVWQEFLRLPRAARKLEPAAAVMLAAQGAFFVLPGLAGVVLAVWAMTGAALPGYAKLVGPGMAAIGAWNVLGLSVALLAAAVGLWHFQFRQRFESATPLLALCAWLFIALSQWTYRADPHNHASPARIPAEAAMREVGGAVVYTLPGTSLRPWLPTLFYANRRIEELPVAKLIEIANAHPEAPMYWMATRGIVEHHKYDPPAVDPKPTALEAFVRGLEEFEKGTGRRGEVRSTWIDEGRQTSLIIFAPRPRDGASSRASEARVPPS